MNIDVTMIADKIVKLCQENNIKVKQMLLECDLSKNTVDNMKRGSMPSVDKIMIIADYFNMSMDYLLTGKEKSSVQKLTETEQECLEKFNALTEIDKGKILERMNIIYMSYISNTKKPVDGNTHTESIQTAARNEQNQKKITTSDIEKLETANTRDY